MKFLYINYFMGILLMGLTTKVKAELSLDPAYIIKDIADIAAFFPKSAAEMDDRYAQAKKDAIEQMEDIIVIPTHERTFENTVLAFDKVMAYFDLAVAGIVSLKKVHPDETLRQKAAEIMLDCADFEINLFQTNRHIYEAIKDYADNNKEVLNAERAYYLKNLMIEFKVAGFDLDADKFQQMQELRKKIAALTVAYQTNMAQDNSTIIFRQDELPGINNEFLENLKQVNEGYVLGCDYPTAFHILSHCKLESTRQAYHYAFKSRAFPQNLELLTQLINLRHELAELLGYESYAQLDILNTMAGTVDQVEQFLEGIATRGRESSLKAWRILMNDLPEGVTLTEEGKLKGWDTRYLYNQYLKKNLDLDHEKIAEYFPMEKTVQGLLDIYEQFFDLKFTVIQGEAFWDPAVQLIEVKDVEKDQIIGYVLTDLFPRPNKYTHACCASLLPPLSFDNGKTYTPALALVVANFTKPTKEKPSLLKHTEVTTFFHEFGHAIHALLGKAEMPTKAAYNTKFDFVETPSQLLEEWMWDPKILKMLSHHYKDGSSLPDDVIEKLINTRSIDEGTNLDNQLQYAWWSLNLYKKGKDKDFAEIKRVAYDKSARAVSYDPTVNTLCSFTHLTGYASKYYTYLWSQQMAKKIFEYINSHGGLLDPKMGKRYRDKIIGRGGSVDPLEMVNDFLTDETMTRL